MAADAPTTPATQTPPAPSRGIRVLKDATSRYSLVLVWIAMSLAFTVALPGVFAQGSVVKAVFGAQQPLVFLGVLALVITLSVGEFDLSFAGIFGFAATGRPCHGGAARLAGAGRRGAGLRRRTGVRPRQRGAGRGRRHQLRDRHPRRHERRDGRGVLPLGLDRGERARPTAVADRAGPVPGAAAPFWYGLVLVLVAAYVMSFTPLGRAMVFVGSNREVARLAGIDVQLFRFLAYLVSALLCALAGTLVAFALGGFDPGSTNTYFLPTFSAVFLGNVAVVPGRFNPLGMFIAVYFLLTGIVGFQLLGYPEWVNEVFYGFALLVAVTVSHFVQKKTRG